MEEFITQFELLVDALEKKLAEYHGASQAAQHLPQLASELQALNNLSAKKELADARPELSEAFKRFKDPDRLDDRSLIDKLKPPLDALDAAVKAHSGIALGSGNLQKPSVAPGKLNLQLDLRDIAAANCAKVFHHLDISLGTSGQQ